MGFSHGLLTGLLAWHLWGTLIHSLTLGRQAVRLSDDNDAYNQRPKGPWNWEGPAAVRADPAAADFADGRGRAERQFSPAFNT